MILIPIAQASDDPAQEAGVPVIPPDGAVALEATLRTAVAVLVMVVVPAAVAVLAMVVVPAAVVPAAVVVPEVILGLATIV